MNTKIFFTDLDGTLLNSQKQISPKTYEVLKQWTGLGHKLVLCSGRALDSVAHVWETLGLKDFPNGYLIGCNGGEIYDCGTGTLLCRTSLPLQTVAKIFSMAKKHQVHIQTYNDTHIITREDNEALAFYHRNIHTPAIITEDVFTYLDKEPCKCLSIELHDKEKLERFRKALMKELGNSITVMYSNPYYLEMIPSSGGKGFGVKWLCNHLNIPLQNALAAGDEHNDISMLQAAGVGIAMRNGTDEVKQIADIVTVTDNDHDGLAPILEQYMK